MCGVLLMLPLLLNPTAARFVAIAWVNVVLDINLPE